MMLDMALDRMIVVWDKMFVIWERIWDRSLMRCYIWHL